MPQFEAVQRAKSGEWHLVDAQGRCFEVADWERVEPFGGAKGIGMRLLGSVFPAPVLTSEARLPLPEFKKKLLSVVRSRYGDVTDKSLAAQIAKKLQSADSYEAAIAALPKL
jgi:hypothetical protein